MFPYVVMLVVPIMMQHFALKGLHMDYQRRNKAALTFFFVWLTLLIALRNESVGNDTRNYLNTFRRFARLNWAALWRGGAEAGYAVFNKLISVFSKEPQVFLAIAAITVSAMIYPTYKRLCIDASLTLVLYCILSTFVMMFSGIRQMIAIGIGFGAYDFTRRKKLIPFILAVLLAISFHTSAFMLAFMYPLYHAKITKNWLWVMIPMLLVCFVYNRQIFGVLAIILEQYTKYDAKIELTGAYTMLILFGVFFVFSYLIPDEQRLDEETIGLRNILLLTFVLQMFAPLHNLAMRMGYYYMIFVPLLIPRIIAYRSQQWSQVAIAARHIMLLFFLLYFFVSASGGGNLNVFPYHFFWENVR